MTAFPVLVRECRTEARRRTNYWLRTLGAAVMVFIFMGLVRRGDQSAAWLGPQLFPQFHTILLLAVLLIAPILTADCLAAEKREGTLPLLLLTPLTPGGIVSAKTFAHAGRGLALVLAALPVLCLPFLLGGVSPTETTLSTLLSLSALFLGLAAGVFASSITQSATRATILAIVIGFGLCLLFGAAYAWSFARWLLPLTLTPASQAPPTFGFWQLLMDYDRYWGEAMAHFPAGGEEAWLALVKLGFGVSSLTALVLLQISGRLVRWSGVERSPSRLIWGGFGWLRAREFLRGEHRFGRLRLRHNPIYWLQQRTWSARVAKWGWVIFVLVGEAALLVTPEHFWLVVQVLVGLGLIFGLIYAAGSSYRYERQNGMLEMILVSPLRAWKLVSGRVRWLWMQFVPAFVVWSILAYLTMPTMGFDPNGFLQFYCFALTIWLVTPVVGLDCAVNFRGRWRPLLITGAAVLLIPGAVFLYRFGEGWTGALLCCVILWIIGMLTTFGLELQMRERRLRYLHPHVARRHQSRRKSRPARMTASVTLRARLG